MKRDMNKIRDLLLKIEAGQKLFEPISSKQAEILGIDLGRNVSEEEARELSYNLKMLEEEGFIRVFFKSAAGAITVDGLTWKGHDLLNQIRG